MLNYSFNSITLLSYLHSLGLVVCMIDFTSREGKGLGGKGMKDEGIEMTQYMLLSL